jgi:hypothetical protein
VEVGAPQGRGAPQRGSNTSTDQATAMVVDHADTKAPEAPKVIDPPAAEKQGINLEIPESSTKGAQKNRGKPYCWRCRSKGHTIHECSIVFCCEICYGDHKTKLCPNMKKNNYNCCSMWLCCGRAWVLLHSSY